jgi:AraC-like DNA-binding protein
MNTLEKDHTTLVTLIAILAKTIQSYDLNFDAIARKSGIDPLTVNEPGNRLPARKIQKMWAIALEQSKDEYIGLRYASYFQPAALHGLGLACITSNTLKDSLNRLIRYQRMLTTMCTFSLEEKGNDYHLRFEHDKAGFEPIPASVDAIISSFYKMCKISIGASFTPKAITLRRAPPSSRDPFDQFFGVPVQFNSKYNTLIFAKQDVENTLPTANPELARMNDQVVIEYLRKFNSDDIEAQVQSTLIEQLPCGVPKQQDTATALNMSIRNLQRRLNEKGSSFKELLNRTRKDLAIHYLQESDKPIIEIGFLLGYVDASNFARAFRRWEGISPLQYRKNHAMSY